jgi:hypothetical protein
MPSTETDVITGVSTSAALKAPVRAVVDEQTELLGELAITDATSDELVNLYDGDRVLVIGQDDATQNGVYVVRATGWERAPDFDGARDVRFGTRIYVAGSLFGYQVMNPDPISVGTTELQFSPFTDASGAGTASQIQNVGPGVGVFHQLDTNVAELKTINAGDGNIEVEDDGEGGITLRVPGGPASSSFDIPFTDHLPVGVIHYRTPSGQIAAFDETENIADVTILTPWPADNTELKAAIDIRLEGRLYEALLPEEAQLIYMLGTLRIAREGGAFIAGTPMFDGDASSGMKLQVGSIGGFVAVAITFRLDATAREVMCITSGTSYSEDNTDSALTLSINEGALTGPTDVCGCSGLVAFNCADETSQPQPCYYESRGKQLYFTGQASNTVGWTGSQTLFTMPPHLLPHNADCFRAIFTSTTGGVTFRALRVDDVTGDVVLLDFGASVTSINFATVPPMPLREF